MSAPADIDDLAMLAEFAQLALDRARAASRRAEAVEAEGGDPSLHLVAFDRMGRAMRLALSLRRRLAGEAQVRAGRRVEARKEQLKAALTPAIRLHAPFADRQELDWALAHRLETEAEAFAALPLEAGVARLSQMLGLPIAAPPADRAEGLETAAGAASVRPAEPEARDLAAPDPPVRARGRAAGAQATGPP